MALGSGGTRGFAHLGVLEVLDELGVEVHAVAGTSIGALIGGLYLTAGLKSVVAELPHLAHLSLFSFVETSLPLAGFIHGNRISERIREMLGRDIRIEDLPKEYYAVATDVDEEEEFVWERGDLITAIRSSSAVPGIFTPVVHEGRVLVDGGLVNPLPI